MTRSERARNLRYRSSILEELNMDDISKWLWDVQCEISEVTWAIEQDGALLEALDGDEEEEFEFRMAFSDLEAEAIKLQDLLEDEYVTEHFNDFFVGLGLKGRSPFKVYGYDAFEADYFTLSSFEAGLAETTAGKRIKRLTKDEILSVAGQCIGIAMAYMDLRHTYDYLKATLDVLRGENCALLRIVDDISKLYDDAFDEYDFVKSYSAFDRMTEQLPDRLWVE